MSFVKKAAKKAFKVIKKVAKKVWKPVLIAGAIAFTGGLATIGFAGMGAAITSGGLLSGIGTTMIAGAQAIGGTLGLTGGLSSGIAAATGAAQGATLGTGVLAQAAGGLLGGGATTGATTGAGITGGAGIGGGASIGGSAAAGAGVGTGVATGAATAGSNFLQTAVGGLRNMASSNLGRATLFNGITQGIQGYMANEQAEKEQKRRDRSNFFGGPMRGGSADTAPEFPSFDSFRDPAGQTNLGSVGPSQNIVAPPIAPGMLPQQGIMAPGNLDLIGEDPYDNQGMMPQMGGYV